MFGSVGIWELLLIFIVALIVFGPKKLPEIGKILGKSLAEFRKTANEFKNSLEADIAEDEYENDIEEGELTAKEDPLEDIPDAEEEDSEDKDE